MGPDAPTARLMEHPRMEDVDAQTFARQQIVDAQGRVDRAVDPFLRGEWLKLLGSWQQRLAVMLDPNAKISMPPMPSRRKAEGSETEVSQTPGD